MARSSSSMPRAGLSKKAGLDACWYSPHRDSTTCCSVPFPSCEPPIWAILSPTFGIRFFFSILLEAGWSCQNCCLCFSFQTFLWDCPVERKGLVRYPRVSVSWESEKVFSDIHESASLESPKRCCQISTSLLLLDSRLHNVRE